MNNYNNSRTPPKREVIEKKLREIQSYMEEGAGLTAIYSALGSGASDDKMERAKQLMRSALKIVKEAPVDKQGGSLLDCSPSSIVDCMVESVAYNLPIDSRGLAYMIKEWDTPTNSWKAKFRVGFRGYVHRLELAYNSKVDVQTGFKWKGDDLTLEVKDGHTSLSHIMRSPFETDFANKFEGAYCYITYWLNGQKFSKFEPMPWPTIQKIRSKAKTGSVWDEWLEEQIKKSVIRRACKLHFLKLVSDLIEKDNEEFDLEQAPRATVTAGGSNLDDLLNKEINGEDEPPHAAPAALEDHSQDYFEVPMDFPPVELPMPEEIPVAVHVVAGAKNAGRSTFAPLDASGINENAVINTLEQATGERPLDVEDQPAGSTTVALWDGKTLVIGGKPVVKDWSNALGAVAYLKSVMLNHKTAASRLKLIDDNQPLLGSLVGEGLGKQIKELREIAGQGE